MHYNHPFFTNIHTPAYLGTSRNSLLLIYTYATCLKILCQDTYTQIFATTQISRPTVPLPN